MSCPLPSPYCITLLLCNRSYLCAFYLLEEEGFLFIQIKKKKTELWGLTMSRVMNYYMYSLESIYTTMEICWTFDDTRERDTTLSITHSFFNSVFSKRCLLFILMHCYPLPAVTRKKGAGRAFLPMRTPFPMVCFFPTGRREKSIPYKERENNSLSLLPLCFFFSHKKEGEKKSPLSFSSSSPSCRIMKAHR